MFKVLEGLANFSHLTEYETYQGQSTGKYSIVLTLSEDDASKLQAQGIKVKEYEGTKQRKFASKYDVTVVDSDDQPFTKEIPYGSKIRIKYKTGPEHPVHGVSVYLEAVRVLELADSSSQYDGDTPF